MVQEWLKLSCQQQVLVHNSIEEDHLRCDAFCPINPTINKARRALFSENKKQIEDEVRHRKTELLEAQQQCEQQDRDRGERERLAEEAKERKRKRIEQEQEELEREMMMADHYRKEELKGKEKLLSKIKGMKEELRKTKLIKQAIKRESTAALAEEEEEEGLIKNRRKEGEEKEDEEKEKKVIRWPSEREVSRSHSRSNRRSFLR